MSKLKCQTIFFWGRRNILKYSGIFQNILQYFGVLSGSIGLKCFSVLLCKNALISICVIQPKKISRESPKIRLSFRYSFMEAEWFLSILQNHRAKGLRRCKKQMSALPSILTPKLKQGMFFTRKISGIKCQIKFWKFWFLGGSNL